jgi:hypothetical protein
MIIALHNYYIYAYIVILDKDKDPDPTWIFYGHWNKYNAVLRIRIRDRGSGVFLTPESGIRKGFFPDPGSRIPNPYF